MPTSKHTPARPAPKAPVRPQARPQAAAQKRTNVPQKPTQPQKQFRTVQQGQAQSSGTGQMSPPLPFQFMKGLVRIYKQTDKDTVNGPRRFVYYVNNVDQQKYKWSTGDPSYIEVLDAIGGTEMTAGDFSVNWSGTKAAGDVTLSIEAV